MIWGSSASTIAAVRGGADHHVARQQQPDAAVDAQRPGRERRVAGAEDHVVLDLLAELGPQGGGDVDLGEHPEPLVLPGRTRTRVTASANGTFRVVLVP